MTLYDQSNTICFGFGYISARISKIPCVCVCMCVCVCVCAWLLMYDAHTHYIFKHDLTYTPTTANPHTHSHCTPLHSLTTAHILTHSLTTAHLHTLTHSPLHTLTVTTTTHPHTLTHCTHVPSARWLVRVENIQKKVRGRNQLIMGLWRGRNCTLSSTNTYIFSSVGSTHSLDAFPCSTPLYTPF